MNEDELQSRLSALPSPPMPDHVTSAISAALAAEAQSRPTDAAEVVALTPRHQRRLSGLLIAAAVAGVLMLLAVTVQSPMPPSETAAPVVRAGAIYEPRDFAEQLKKRFLQTPAASGPTNTFADSPAGIAACTDAVDAFGNVMGVDTGSYGDAAAVVLITSYPAHAEYEEIWVVSPSCGTGDVQVIRHMVYDVDDSTASL
jgi:hypothetical protein